MKLTTKQLKKIVQEEYKKTLKEGQMKAIFGEFLGLVETYKLTPEDILGMMDMIWPSGEEVDSVVADS